MLMSLASAFTFKYSSNWGMYGEYPGGEAQIPSICRTSHECVLCEASISYSSSNSMLAAGARSK